MVCKWKDRNQWNAIIVGFSFVSNPHTGNPTVLASFFRHTLCVLFFNLLIIKATQDCAEAEQASPHKIVQQQKSISTQDCAAE